MDYTCTEHFHLNVDMYVVNITIIMICGLFSLDVTYVRIAIGTMYLRTRKILDVLLGQPIKLIQIVSTSEFHEY